MASTEIGGLYFDVGLNLDDITGEFEELQDTMGEALDSAPADKLNEKMDNIAESTKKINKELKDTNASMKEASNGTSEFAVAAEGIGSALKKAFEIKMIIEFSKACLTATGAQQTAEVKLISTMRQRMDATKEEIQNVKDLASEMQKVGIVGDEVALAGASQFARYSDSIEALEALLPAMADVAVAASNGEAVTSEKMIDAGKKLGKAMSTGSLSELEEYGIVVTDAELASWERLTDEEEKAAYLADLINSRIGNMNEVMRGQFNGAFQGLMNDMGDVMEKWGRILQVGLLPAINIIDAIVLKLGEFTDKIMDFFGIEMVDSSVNSLVGGSQAISENMAQATEEAEELQRILLGFDKAYVLPSNDKKASTSSGSNVYNNYYSSNKNSTNSSILPDDDGEKEAHWIWTKTKRLGEAAGTAWDRFINMVQEKIEGNEELDKFLDEFGSNLEKDWQGFFDTAIRMLEDPTYWTEIGDAFGNVFTWIGDQIELKVSDFFDGIKTWWSGVTNKWGFTEADDNRARNGSIRTNTDPRTTGQKIWDVLTWMPQFAEGGFVKANTPTLAVFGEGNQDEYALPEGKLKALLQSAASSGSQDSAILNEILQAVKSMRLTANVDATSLARLVVKIIRDEERSTGRSLI